MRSESPAPLAIFLVSARVARTVLSRVVVRVRRPDSSQTGEFPLYAVDKLSRNFVLPVHGNWISENALVAALS